MSDAQPPSNEPKSDVIPLEDIDNLLAAEDPEFVKSMAEVQAVESNAQVTIDAMASDEGLVEAEKAEPPKKLSRFGKFKMKVGDARRRFVQRLKLRLANLVRDFIIFLKTRPKEFFFFALATTKRLARASTVPIAAFRKANRVQRVGALILCLFSLCGLWVLLANLRGIWLPQLSEPILQSLVQQADSVTQYDPKSSGESFYSAFPQERYEFLFKKMKTNLRRSEDSPNPMGAFELIALLDSKDTAIEVRDRQVEFFDLLQRVFEGEDVTELESERGKERLKSKLKKELNQKLTQGWVKDINFKTFILKP